MRIRVHFVSRECCFAPARRCGSDVLQSSEAAEKVLNDKRKTINGEDILYGMTALGFDNYAEACKVYLAKYRSVSVPLKNRMEADSLAETTQSRTHFAPQLPRAHFPPTVARHRII